jgi:hypothetical protein
MEESIIEELRNLKRTGKGNPEEFFGKLFHSRDVIHLAHLSTKSYAAHKALGGYYEDIVDLTDSIIEAYQGVHGLVKISIPAATSEEPIKYLQNLHSYVDANKDMFKDSALLNQIDEVKSLIQSTLYKLRFLG